MTEYNYEDSTAFNDIILVQDYIESNDGIASDITEDTGKEDDALIEYEEEFDEDYIPNTIDEDDLETLKKHTLQLLQDPHGLEIYHCLQCGTNYDNLSDFATTHGQEVAVIKDETDIVDIFDADSIEPMWQLQDSEAEDFEVNNVAEEDITIKQEHVTVDDNFEHISDDGRSEKQAKSIEDTTDKYLCYDCHTVFADLTSAEQHDCAHPIEKLVQEVKKTKSIRNVKSTAPVKCDICNTIFNSAKNLKFHMRIHDKRATKSIQDALPADAQKQYSELNQFYCEICNKSFDQNLLAIHKNMHQNVEEHTCGICNRKFENLPSYEIHLKLHALKPNVRRRSNATAGAAKVQHGETGKTKFPCQYCGHVFGRPYEKVKHERIHTGEKPYECEVCGKTFRVCYSLTLHLRTHTNIRPYACTTCNKRFKSYQVYAHHLLTHSTECAYQCDICSKSFRTSVHLYAHKNSHNKPFKCTECNRPFASLYAVKKHMKTHNRQDKNISSTSSSASIPNNHSLSCSICGAVYSRLYALRSHMRDSHGVDQETVEHANNVQDSSQSSQSDEAAILIAAADSSHAYMERVKHNYVAQNEVVEETVLQQDAFTLDNFSNEVVVEDWLEK